MMMLIKGYYLGNKKKKEKKKKRIQNKIILINLKKLSLNELIADRYDGLAEIRHVERRSKV
jgi:hypothetical protein